MYKQFCFLVDAEVHLVGTFVLEFYNIIRYFMHKF